MLLFLKLSDLESDPGLFGRLIALLEDILYLSMITITMGSILVTSIAKIHINSDAVNVVLFVAFTVSLYFCSRIGAVVVRGCVYLM